jgi:hypothetical protein
MQSKTTAGLEAKIVPSRPAYAGTDFITVRDGRIAAVYLFFDHLPWDGLYSRGTHTREHREGVRDWLD